LQEGCFGRRLLPAVLVAPERFLKLNPAAHVHCRDQPILELADREIGLVPISTSLSGLAASDATESSVMIYGTHPSLIALVNLLLWIEVHRNAVAHLQIVRSSLVVALFLAALAVGAARPSLALCLWIAVLAAPPLARQIVQRFLAH
jgi:hypothetical protein